MSARYSLRTQPTVHFPRFPLVESKDDAPPHRHPPKSPLLPIAVNITAYSHTYAPAADRNPELEFRGCDDAAGVADTFAPLVYYGGNTPLTATVFGASCSSNGLVFDGE